MGASIPTVLVVGGHDPTGGAGIQADIESIVACGAYPVTLISTSTVQDTRCFSTSYGVDEAVVSDQARVLLRDITPGGVKVGMLGSVGMVAVVAGILEKVEGPVILDPVLGAGGGGGVVGEEVAEAIRAILIPGTYLCTPNTVEATRLTGRTSPQGQADEFFRMGCENVLITGTHDSSTENVINRLFCRNGYLEEWQWPRLSGVYHGSGCTLASAAAAKLVMGLPISDALKQAQAFTWKALSNAYRVGGGQAIPARR